MRHAEVTADNHAGSEDFPSYQGLFWRTLAALARRGHHVPPDEGRDVIHDFYVEAWAGVLNRYQPERAKFSSYLIGAFMRFAARRLAQMQATRSQLVDFDSELGLPSDLLGPDEQLDAAQQAARIQAALSELPGLQRQLLLAYVIGEGATERALAARMSSSRHAVRQALADGLATLARSYAQAGLHESDARLLQLAWAEGRVSEDIATQIGCPVQIVRQKRERYARQTLRLLRDSTHGEAPKVEETMDYANLIKHAAFGSDRAAVLAAVAEHAPALREFLASDGGGELHFSAAERERLEEHPARLAEVYELLYPPAAEYEDEVSASVERFTRDRVKELRAAFEDMVACLPKSLRLWNEYFVYQSTPREVDWLLSKAGSGQVGEAALQLARIGLTPESFAQSWGGFGLLFEQPDFERHLPRRAEPCLHVVQENGRISPLYFGDLVLTAQETPGLPDEVTTAEGMAKWTLQALRVLPFLVPGYRAALRPRGLVVEPFNTANMSLGARWTRRALESKSFRYS